MENGEKPDWLTEMDEEILRIMSTGLTLGPTTIADNIGRSREGVSNRLNSLQAGGLVEKVDRGKYRLTDQGDKFTSDYSDFHGLSDSEKIGVKRTVEQINQEIRDLFGVSPEEYAELVEKEHGKMKEKEDCDYPFIEAKNRVEKRLREEKEDDKTSSE